MDQARGYHIRVANVAVSATDAGKSTLYVCTMVGNIIMNWHLGLVYRLNYHCGFSMSVSILCRLVKQFSAVGNIAELASVDARVLGSAWL